MAELEQKQQGPADQAVKQESAADAGQTAAPQSAAEAEAERLRSERAALETQLSGLSEKREALNRELQAAQKELNRERDSLIKEKRGEISGAYDAQLKAADAEIRSVNDQRQKAREQGVKARIADRTASLHEENKELKQKLANIFKDNHVPAIARTGLFYAYTMPRGLREGLTAFITFLLVFGLLPFGLHSLLPQPAAWHWAVIYVAVVLVFGGIYVALSNLKTKHLGPLREGRKVRDQIRANGRQINKIAREIRRDKDDALYDLGAFDDHLAQRTQERADTERKKSEALEQFDAVTRSVLSDEVAARYEEHFNTLQQSLSELDAKTKELEEKIKRYGKIADSQGNL